MPYVSRGTARRRSGRYGRSTAATNTKIIARRPTASAQRAQILALNRKYNTLARKQSNITERVSYMRTLNSEVSAVYTAFPLVQPNVGWFAAFGNSDNVTESRKLNIHNMFMDFKVYPNNEDSCVDFTIFLVTPKNNQVMRETGAMVAFSEAAKDFRYLEGICMMNPKRFTVHKSWRVQAQNQENYLSPTASSTQKVSFWNARRTHYMPFKRQLRNSSGTWSQIANAEIPISSALTLLVFNNNNTSDSQSPAIKGMCKFDCSV